VRDPDRWARPTGAVLREIWRSSPRAPLRSPLGREVDVRIYSQDMAVYSLVLYSVRRQRYPTVRPRCHCWDGTFGQRARRSCPWRVHCFSARLGSPITGHHHARSAVTGLHTVRVLCVVIRRAALETDGLRGVSLPAPCVSSRPHLLTLARPTQLPH
jgi:hypothetical protein